MYTPQPQGPTGGPATVPPPAVPNAPAPGTATLPQAPAARVVLTPRDIASLEVRRSELGTQLNSALSRRREVIRELQRAPVDEAAVRQRLDLLDKRILQLETDLADVGRQLSQASYTTTSTVPPFNFPRGRMDPTPIFVVFILFVLAPLSFAYVWRMFKRPSPPALPPGWNEHLQRMDRVEQAVDTIAIEIERISEGQRFLTKILSDPQSAGRPAADGAAPKALGAGAAEPIVMEQREAVRARN